MKRLLLGLVLVLGFAQFNNLAAQEGEFYLGSITYTPIRMASTGGDVKPLLVCISDSTGAPFPFIPYSARTWYMYIIYVNTSSSAKSFKLEYDLRYGDGASYYVYRKALSIAANTCMSYRINVTTYVAKLGLLTLTGRVYGTGMGNDNKITSQVFVY
jgi:hypothetical protein